MGRLEWTAYDALGLRPGATQDEIKAAWKVKAKALHPDFGGDSELFDRAARAYEELSNTNNPLIKVPSSSRDSKETAPRASNSANKRNEGTARSGDQDAPTPNWDRKYDLYYQEPIKRIYKRVNRRLGIKQNKMLIYPKVLKIYKAKKVEIYKASRKVAKMAYDKNMRAGSSDSKAMRMAKRAGHLFIKRYKNPNYVEIGRVSSFAIYLTALVLTSLGQYLRFSGISARLLIISNVKKIIFNLYQISPPKVENYPLHLVGVVLSTLAISYLIWFIWITLLRRGHFSTLSQILIGSICIFETLLGELLLSPRFVIPVASLMAVYISLSGRVGIYKLVVKIRSALR